MPHDPAAGADRSDLGVAAATTRAAGSRGAADEVPAGRSRPRGATGGIGSLRDHVARAHGGEPPAGREAAPPIGDTSTTTPSPGPAALTAAGGLVGSSAGAGRTAAPAPSVPAGRVLEVEDVGPSVRIIRVGRPAGLRFEGGQYLKAGLPDGRTASFSIASAPHDPHVELCIERIPGGRLTPQLFGLGPGSQMAIGDRAKGSFTLDRGAAVHLMVATVTGIAPLRSMLRQALHEGSRARFVVLHGASRADELPYHDELAALAAGGQLTYTPTVSRPTEAANATWRGRTGRVDPLASEVGASLDPATTSAYACGNPGMVANVRRDLGALGFRVRSEVFD